MRIAIFGDVSGHYDPFRAGLATVGADLDNGTLPDDLIVVQVGDLIHKGPDSEWIVATVDDMIQHYPERWIQLLGNHEGHYLASVKFWRDEVDEHVIQQIVDWINDGRAQMSAAFDTVEHGEVLITHAGMTHALWLLIGCPTSAADAAERLNKILYMGVPEDPYAGVELAFEPGVMLQGAPMGRAGVAWAEPTTELWPSWQGQDMPFTQIHGHASGWLWSKKQWMNTAPLDLRGDAVIDKQLRQLTVNVGGKKIIGIDPDYGQYAPARPLLPLVLTES